MTSILNINYKKSLVKIKHYQIVQKLAPKFSRFCTIKHDYMNICSFQNSGGRKKDQTSASPFQKMTPDIHPNSSVFPPK